MSDSRIDVTIGLRSKERLPDWAVQYALIVYGLGSEDGRGDKEARTGSTAAGRGTTMRGTPVGQTATTTPPTTATTTSAFASSAQKQGGHCGRRRSRSVYGLAERASLLIICLQASQMSW